MTDDRTQHWQQASIETICEKIVDCLNRTAPVCSEITPYKMIRTSNVKNGFINLEEVKYVTKEVFEKWTRRDVPRKGDILLTREAPLGEVGMLRDDDHVFLGQRIVMYRADNKKADSQFLFYALRGPYLQSQIQSFGSGSTVAHMRVPDAKKLIVPLPPLGEQQKIGSVLGALDDLIENNTRRIQILEKMARLLYREWFVHYRFPTHEKVKMVDSGTDLGEVPEGWERKRIADVANVLRGRAYKGSELADQGGLPFVNLKCFVRDGGFREDGIKRYTGEYKPHQTAKAGDIIMAVTDMTQERRVVARAARVPQLDEPLFVFSMDTVKIEPVVTVPREYLYAMFRFSDFADVVKQHANGANVLHLSPVSIEEHIFLCPPDEVTVAFANIIRPIFSLADCLSLRNSKLRQTRDLLLPKLVSGQLTIS